MVQPSKTQVNQEKIQVHTRAMIQVQFWNERKIFEPKKREQPKGKNNVFITNESQQNKRKIYTRLLEGKMTNPKCKVGQMQLENILEVTITFIIVSCMVFNKNLTYAS